MGMDFVEAGNKFSLIRKLLGAISLSHLATDYIIDRFTGFLSDMGESTEGAQPATSSEVLIR